ncbi:ATP-binding cassette sub-family C member 10 isoform X2 [Schistocerca americana]|uniref:ATP-binding cassette sub-family C member 10 isoform X2 n=1 Tax=Schistocerca americana TaxID=7009 RepID=UPI001F4FC369|nr:ATP-binding cassette sub-family C member 10 isoform X2 [Schistocerca americana]
MKRNMRNPNRLLDMTHDGEIWLSMCGSEDSSFWNPEMRDVGRCFQAVMLQTPTLAVLATVSAYQWGKSRGLQTWTGAGAAARVPASLLLALLGPSRLLAARILQPQPLSELLAAGTGLVAWAAHAGCAAAGPPNALVLTPIVAQLILVIMSTRSSVLSDDGRLVWDVATLISLSVYILSLILYFRRYRHRPRRQSCRHCQVPESEASERTPLTGSSTGETVWYGGFHEDDDPAYLGTASEGANPLSRLLFLWVSPLIDKGSHGRLKSTDDLFDLPSSLSPALLGANLRNALSDGASLMRALHRQFGVVFYSVGILKLAADVCGFAGPLLLNGLVKYVETGDENRPSEGYVYALGLCLSTLCGALFSTHFTYLVALVGLQLRGALISMVYRKAMSVPGPALSSFSTGEVVNFMSTDTDRVVNACASFHAFWSIPLQVAVTLYLLYIQLGLSFLAGVAVTVLLIPVNKLLANKIGVLSSRLMASKDKRVQLLAEALAGIRTLKVLVWEDYFLSLINKVRSEEVKYLRGRKFLDALCVFFWAATPVLMSVLTFGTFALLGGKLTASTVFTGVALLQMLIAPLNAFPWVLNGIAEAWVSIGRLEKLMRLEDLDPDHYYSKMPTDSGKTVLQLANASFSWSSTLSVLKNINITIKKGQLVGVCGHIGSGKSSLLAAIVADLELQSGSISLTDPKTAVFGLVAQSPWLQRGSVRDNILFGRPYEQAKYRRVVEACCLDGDLQQLSAGDQTDVGEAGAALSGGQKVRIALARAVYQDMDIYLFDDILAAVDVPVAAHIFQHCVLGLLQGKTRILCTHHVHYLTSADAVVVLALGGRVSSFGSPDEVMSELDGQEFKKEESEVLPIDSMGDTGDTKDLTVMSQNEEHTIEEEERETGAVAWNVYASYWKAVGHFLAVAVLLSVTGMQTSRNLTDCWLGYWVTQASNNNVSTDQDQNFYLTVYGSLAASNLIFTLARAFLFAWGGIQAAVIIHRRLLNVIIRAKVSFFDTTPLGRILNRFSSDTYAVDDSLPFILNILLAQVFSLLGTLAVTLYGLPWLVLVVVPLVPVYYRLQATYRLSARELKRLSSITLSPVYSHFSESLAGRTTVRALGGISRFCEENDRHLEASQKCQLAARAAEQWMGLRLQLVGVAVVGGVGLAAVVQRQLGTADAGLVGLAISYALSATGVLGGVANAFAETEREMVAVERVLQYVQSVEKESQGGEQPPYGWPAQGVVSFNGVVLRYREDVVASLQGVSFETRPGEKLGVVGRTGAGKSSLLAALFRLTDPSSGRITIDRVNTASLSLSTLRSRLAAIPQDPWLFSGTVHENLDPEGRHSPAELETALRRVGLWGAVRALGGPAADVGPGGKKLSTGQRQLLCLARAVLRAAKVVCVDEATAHVDAETDRAIQCALRNAFQQSTVICIAHRPHAVADFDRVMVMGGGKVLELDSPDALLKDEKSHFYQLVGPQLQMSFS